MIRKIQIVFALSMGVLAGVMLAQTDADFQGWMKGAVAAKGKLATAITAKDAPGVTAAATALADNFGKIQEFFSKRGPGAADAVAIAKGNVDAANKMGPAAAKGDFDAVAAGAAVIGGSCNGCHMAHREGAKGGPYSIK
jgi:cytochrome c556